MKIRLGYVAISKTLSNITTSSTLTYSNYSKLDNKNEVLDKIIKSNLEALNEILIYNKKNNIHFYRMSSNLIPLATHDKVNFDYISDYKPLYKKVANTIKNTNIRVDFHPNQYCILNSVSKSVIKNSIEILEYHENLLREFELNNSIILLHVGSMAGGKKAATSRFINNFNKLPENIRQVIALENDDKVYKVEDTLYICEKLNIPCVLDYHHYLCNHEKNINDLLPRIFNTWKNNTVKMHFSSPKSKLKREFRSHNDYIEASSFICFLEMLKPYNIDIDIMLEAKEKDVALFKLVRELKYKTNYNFIDETSFIIN